MGATHQLVVEANSGAHIRLRISTLHPDEHHIWLLKTALLSMLYSALEAEEVEEEVREVYEQAGGDEPEDARSAAKVLKAVGEPELLAGELKKSSRKRLVFAEGGTVRLELELREARLGRHLRPGTSWTAAPLFPELG